MNRRSYRRLAELPAYGLFRASGELVASIRALSAAQARDLFRRAGYGRQAQPGDRIRRLDASRPD
jgi:hypothetical protein